MDKMRKKMMRKGQIVADKIEKKEQIFRAIAASVSFMSSRQLFLNRPLFLASDTLHSKTLLGNLFFILLDFVCYNLFLSHHTKDIQNLPGDDPAALTAPPVLGAEEMAPVSPTVTILGPDGPFTVALEDGPLIKVVGS